MDLSATFWVPGISDICFSIKESDFEENFYTKWTMYRMGMLSSLNLSVNYIIVLSPSFIFIPPGQIITKRSSFHTWGLGPVPSPTISLHVGLSCPQLRWHRTNGNIHHSLPKSASASGRDWHSFPWSWRVKTHYLSLSHFPGVFMGPISKDSESCSCWSISGTRREVWLYYIVIHIFLSYDCGRILLLLWVIRHIVEKL